MTQENQDTMDIMTASASRPWKLSIVATSVPAASGSSSSMSLKSCTWATYGDCTTIAVGLTPAFQIQIIKEYLSKKALATGK